MQTTFASGISVAIRWRASDEAKYVGAISPTHWFVDVTWKWDWYQGTPRSKCVSKNRVSLVGCGSTARPRSTSCSHVVPVRGGPTTKNDGSERPLSSPRETAEAGEGTPFLAYQVLIEGEGSN